ncbi:type III secretion system protein,type III secretion apparatus protein, HrpE/YscL family,Flagellar assembly protein FliH [Chlamydia serpentis]|uniref:Flagellar assembly protein FliH n=1 Tax=Chlamydia serpentis TaxID=1967782 RepID=A0A2R8FC08_9CHLA|nr:HrpE/YscL family type III secretion apparatus protein [Chlamydia serpentis]SPN73938.1 type III secretion system protein,type III secretion apparatus protein, HrpE/YscL family,Flagellar assembly protein FliH [Chlamydia serpentis]
MKFFSLIFKNDDISPNKKVLSPEAFSAFLDAKELLETTKADSKAYLAQTEEECIHIRQEAKEQGLKEGAESWSQQIAFLQEETKNLRTKVREALVPLAIASVKKIIGKELETHPETIVSIISQALKDLTQNKNILIHVNPKDLPLVEKSRPEFKKIVEYADALILTAKSDVAPGGCIIETEAGIVNAQLDVQLDALEKAFSTILKLKDPTDEYPDTPSSTDSPSSKAQDKKE